MNSAMRRLLPVMVFLALLAGAAVAGASILRVRQDGSGDYTTVAAAIGMAMPGDQLQVGPGTYPEPLVISISLSIVSTDGVGATILDGQNSQRILHVTNAAVCRLEGLTFLHGRIDLGTNGQGGAIHVDGASRVTIFDCSFVENVSSWDAGAIYARHSGTEVRINNSRFERNEAYWNGGACGVSLGALMAFDRCVLLDNHVDRICGGVAAYTAILEMTDCIMARNRGQGVGAVRSYDSTLKLRHNTFHGNAGPSHGTVLVEGFAASVFEHNIVTSEQAGFGLRYSETEGAHSCNLFFDCANGALSGGTLGDSEVVADPLYCDYPADDYRLCLLSPALPTNNNCGLMGAFGLGCDSCGPIGTEDSSWGNVKRMYR